MHSDWTALYGHGCITCTAAHQTPSFSVCGSEQEIRMRQYVFIITDCRDMPLKSFGFFGSLNVISARAWLHGKVKMAEI